jgi:hypothetical protein
MATPVIPATPITPVVPTTPTTPGEEICYDEVTHRHLIAPGTPWSPPVYHLETKQVPISCKTQKIRNAVIIGIVIVIIILIIVGIATGYIKPSTSVAPRYSTRTYPTRTYASNAIYI